MAHITLLPHMHRFARNDLTMVDFGKKMQKLGFSCLFWSFSPSSFRYLLQSLNFRSVSTPKWRADMLSGLQRMVADWTSPKAQTQTAKEQEELAQLSRDITKLRQLFLNYGKATLAMSRAGTQLAQFLQHMYGMHSDSSEAVRALMQSSFHFNQQAEDLLGSQDFKLDTLDALDTWKIKCDALHRNLQSFGEAKEYVGHIGQKVTAMEIARNKKASTGAPMTSREDQQFGAALSKRGKYQAALDVMGRALTHYRNDVLDQGRINTLDTALTSLMQTQLTLFQTAFTWTARFKPAIEAIKAGKPPPVAKHPMQVEEEDHDEEEKHEQAFLDAQTFLSKVMSSMGGATGSGKSERPVSGQRVPSPTVSTASGEVTATTPSLNSSTASEATPQSRSELPIVDRDSPEREAERALAQAEAALARAAQMKERTKNSKEQGETTK
eukprot:g79153.t1